MNKKIKVGFYPGSFNPFHLGHLDIVRQAQAIFDLVIVGRGINPTKADVNRVALPEKFLFDMEVGVRTYNSLLVDEVKRMEAEDANAEITVVRGLRNGADLEYEQNLVSFLKDIYPKIKVVHILGSPKYRHISSSALRDIQKFSPEEYKKYVISD